MCGIVGYTGSNINIVKRAHTLQTHRGPDDEGFYSDEYISLGHNRLAIIDLNPRSAQPMWDKDHRFCIVFNGEIYNYQELKQAYLTDYPFQTASDTEVILAIFSKLGKKGLSELRGMFAFVIYDSQNKEVHMARDFFGIKPLYYYLDKSDLFFSSEIKASVYMAGALSKALDLDIDSINTYTTMGYTIAPNTIYTQIKEVLPGEIITVDILNKNKTISLLSPKVHTENEQALTILKDAITQTTISDVPIANFFSGGVDSSLIAAVLQENKINTTQVSSYVENRSNDSYYFNKISQSLDLSIHVTTFDYQAFKSTYTYLRDKIDNPSGCNSIFQVLHLAQFAKQYAKVVLLGDGADEIFLGYERSIPLAKMNDAKLDKGQWLEKLYILFPNFPGKHKLFSKCTILFKIPFLYYLIEMNIQRDYLTQDKLDVIRRQFIKRNSKPLELDQHGYLSSLLTKNDIATSLCSIEGRVPFLNPDLVSMSQINNLESVKSNTPKKILKTILSKYISSELVYRKKSGFGIPYKTYLNISNLEEDYNEAVTFLSKLTSGNAYKKYDYYRQRDSQFPINIALLFKSIQNNQKIYQNGLNDFKSFELPA